MNNRVLCFAAAALAVSLSACHSAYETARDRDTAEAYRDFLRNNPNDPSAKAARLRLAELEFLSARRQHTLPAYKRFLITFPNSPRAQDAKLLIEGIRFEMAAEKDTSEAWLIFLRDHAQGPHAAEARARLEDADYRALENARTSKEIRTFLGRHPATKRRAELEKKLDELEFQEADSIGAKGLAAYLETNPSGIHRAEVKSAILTREAVAESALGNFSIARKLAQKIVDDAPRKELLDRIDALELEWTASLLNMGKLDAFIGRLEDRHEETPILDEAKKYKALFAKTGAAELKRLADLADPYFFARPEDELVAGLKSADPRNRWLAAMELGNVAGSSKIDPLLAEAAASKFSRVRLAAFEALQNIFGVLPKDAIDITIRSKISDLEKKTAQDAILSVKLAVLYELSGDAGKAITSYENALKIVPDDTFCLRRCVILNKKLGKDFRAGVLARELAFRVKQHAEQWASASDSDGANPLLLARTLCGTLDDDRFALDHLKHLSSKALEDLADDAGDFIAMAEESVSFTAARLDDAEAEARSRDNSFVRCSEEKELKERLGEGVQRRLKAIEELSGRQDEFRRLLLKRMALRDPDASVRSAAALHLEDATGFVANDSQETESRTGAVPPPPAGAQDISPNVSEKRK